MFRGMVRLEEHLEGQVYNDNQEPHTKNVEESTLSVFVYYVYCTCRVFASVSEIKNPKWQPLAIPPAPE